MPVTRRFEKDEKSIGSETYPILYLFNAVGYLSEIRSIGRIFLCESYSALLIRLKRVKSALSILVSYSRGYLMTFNGFAEFEPF